MKEQRIGKILSEPKLTKVGKGNFIDDLVLSGVMRSGNSTGDLRKFFFAVSKAETVILMEGVACR